MATTSRARTLAAAQEELWATVGDPRELPRWWPRVQRVEAADDDHFTEVLGAASGRPVRADFRIAEHDAPRRCHWEQELTGTPFERHWRRVAVSIELESSEAAQTRVTLTLTRVPSGFSLLGGPLVRRASARELEAALDRLEELHGG